MIRLAFLVCFCFGLLKGLLPLCQVQAQQGLNNLWLGGFGSGYPPPYGSVDLQFISGNLVLNTTSRDIGFRRTCANISDLDGVLLFSTNGVFVANALGDTMVNGSGLNPGSYSNQYPQGLYSSQIVLILPKPEDSNIYYLLHMTIDNSVDI